MAKTRRPEPCEIVGRHAEDLDVGGDRQFDARRRGAAQQPCGGEAIDRPIDAGGRPCKIEGEIVQRQASGFRIVACRYFRPVDRYRAARQRRVGQAAGPGDEVDAGAFELSALRVQGELRGAADRHLQAAQRGETWYDALELRHLPIGQAERHRQLVIGDDDAELAVERGGALLDIDGEREVPENPALVAEQGSRRAACAP